MTDYYKLYRKQQIQIESLLAELDTRTMERDYWHNATAFALKQNKNDNNRLRQDIAKLTDENERLRAALESMLKPDNGELPGGIMCRTIARQAL